MTQPQPALSMPDFANPDYTWLDHLKAPMQQYGEQQVLSDFLTVMACAVTAGQREDEYTQTASRYPEEVMTCFSQAAGLLAFEALTGDRYADHVGAVYADMLDEDDPRMRYYVPPALAQLMAAMNVNGDVFREDSGTSPLVTDPLCGCGIMLLEAARMRSNLLPDAPDITAHALDTDMDACNMTTVQMALARIPGRVSLIDPQSHQVIRSWTVPANFLSEVAKVFNSAVQRQVENLNKTPSRSVAAMRDGLSPALRELTRQLAAGAVQLETHPTPGERRIQYSSERFDSPDTLLAWVAKDDRNVNAPDNMVFLSHKGVPMSFPSEDEARRFFDDTPAGQQLLKELLAHKDADGNYVFAHLGLRGVRDGKPLFDLTLYSSAVVLDSTERGNHD